VVLFDHITLTDVEIECWHDIPLGVELRDGRRARIAGRCLHREIALGRFRRHLIAVDNQDELGGNKHSQCNSDSPDPLHAASNTGARIRFRSDFDESQKA